MMIFELKGIERTKELKMKGVDNNNEGVHNSNEYTAFTSYNTCTTITQGRLATTWQVRRVSRCEQVLQEGARGRTT